MAGTQRRRSLRLLDPALQLTLPLQLLAVTLLFEVGLTAAAWAGFLRPYSLVMEELPPHAAQTLQLVVQDFGLVVFWMALLYGILVVGLSVMYLRRMVGPTIAFRRHLEALKAGDYAARASLRKGDPFQELAQDLNELAALLEADEKPAASPPGGPAPGSPAGA